MSDPVRYHINGLKTHYPIHLSKMFLQFCCFISLLRKSVGGGQMEVGVLQVLLAAVGEVLDGFHDDEPPMEMGRDANAWLGKDDSSCEGNGGNVFSRRHWCKIVMGARASIPVAEENFVCCLPNVLPSTCGDQALSRRLRRQSVRGISRIVGGAETKAHSWPWQVSLQLNDNNFHFCGGTLISDQWVVTAAHCLVGDSTVARVVLGEHDRSTENGREITSSATVFSHQNYENSAPYPNDIALLKLKTPVALNDNIHPACLPENGTTFDTGTDDCWITGWGDTKDTGDESKLNELQISIVDNESCASKWGENYILKTNICVGDGLSGACNGDSGGPLSCRRQGEQAWELAGVTSWGASGCQSEGLPNVYTRVSQYRQWILATMRKNL
ncbi:chymotrypsin B-like [Ruditapes philippinarum]|uniref:chymotrypsin B-like n=1 Tax=Ruditapes philippinarum TaxID=129788 RepID=UPI00295C2446|nr:chymotrypsin B-like [Ruditapes philippinarum]